MSIRNEFKINCERQNWGQSIAIKMMHNGAYASNVTFEQQADGMIIPNFLDLPIDTAQELMDELWHCGLRPSDGTGSAGSLRATEKHLEDMRKLAFHKIMPKMEITGAP